MYDAIAVKIISPEPTTGFRQLYILGILCDDGKFTVVGVPSSGHDSTTIYTTIVTIQSNVTGVICRVVTPKDKERI